MAVGLFGFVGHAALGALLHFEADDLFDEGWGVFGRFRNRELALFDGHLEADDVAVGGGFAAVVGDGRCVMEADGRSERD